LEKTRYFYPQLVVVVELVPCVNVRLLKVEEKFFLQKSLTSPVKKSQMIGDWDVRSRLKMT